MNRCIAPDNVFLTQSKSQAQMTVLLSIIIPFNDNAETLPDTLRSLSTALAEVPSGDVEVLFVDNKSTDGSRALAESFCAVRPNARCVEEPRLGVSFARNAGVAAAQGEYIASVDSDDLISSDYAAEIVHAVRQNPDLIIIPFASKVSIQGPSFTVQRRDALTILTGWWCWQFVFRRTSASGLIFGGKCYEDLGFFPKLLERSQRVMVVRGNLYEYRMNANSLTSRDVIWRLGQLEEVSRDLLADGVLTDQDVIRRVTKDILRGKMQLRAIGALWPILSARDIALLIALSPEERAAQIWQILRLSASVMRRKVVQI